MRRSLKLESIRNYIIYLYKQGYLNALEDFLEQCFENQDVDCLEVIKELEKSSEYPALNTIITKVKLSLDIKKGRLRISSTFDESKASQRFIPEDRFEVVESDTEVIDSDVEVIESDVDVIEDERPRTLIDELRDRALLYPVSHGYVYDEKIWKKYLKVKEFKQLYPSTWKDRLRNELLAKEIRKRGLNIDIHEFKQLYPVTYMKLMKKIEKKLREFEELVGGDVHEDHKD